MAREDRSADDLDEYGATLNRIALTVTRVVAKMREAEIPTILVHGETAVNRYLPALEKWASSLEVDCNLQIKAYRKGEIARAAILKQQAATQMESRRKKAGKKAEK